MSNQNRPKAPFAKTETEAPSAPVAEAVVEVAAEAVVEAPAPAPEPLKLGAPLAAILKAAVNDMHHYGVISDTEAVSLKERLEAKV